GEPGVAAVGGGITRARNAPRWTRTVIAAPGETSIGSRIARPFASVAIAYPRPRTASGESASRLAAAPASSSRRTASERCAAAPREPRDGLVDLLPVRSEQPCRGAEPAKTAVDRGAPIADHACRRAGQARLQVLERGAARGRVGHHQLSRLRGRRRARVSGE